MNESTESEEIQDGSHTPPLNDLNKSETEAKLQDRKTSVTKSKTREKSESRESSRNESCNSKKKEDEENILTSDDKEEMEEDRKRKDSKEEKKRVKNKNSEVGVKASVTRKKSIREGGSSDTKTSEKGLAMQKQLEQEVKYSMTLQNLRQVWEQLSSKDPETSKWSVGILQTSIKELEEQLRLMEQGADNEEHEFRLRYEAQNDLNAKLEDQISWYENEAEIMKERVKKGNESSMDLTLDNMTEFELAHLEKQLERERNNLYGDLRNKSWLLDSYSKDYFNLRELIKAYTGDLNIVNRSLEEIWRKKSQESSFVEVTPGAAPGSLRWSGESGIRPNQRVIDPRRGPVRKTVGVRSLPRLDLKDNKSSNVAVEKKQRKSKSQSRPNLRTKSLDIRRPVHPPIRKSSESAKSVRDHLPAMTNTSSLKRTTLSTPNLSEKSTSDNSNALSSKLSLS